MPQQCRIPATSGTCALYSSWQCQIVNPLSKPGIELETSWLLVGLVSTAPQRTFPHSSLLSSLAWYFNFIYLFISLVSSGPHLRHMKVSGAGAAGLHHSHSNPSSTPHLPPTLKLRQRWILNLLNAARDQTCILLDTVLDV